MATERARTVSARPASRGVSQSSASWQQRGDAFQKKSKSGIATPKHEIDVVRERIKRLKEALS